MVRRVVEAEVLQEREEAAAEAAESGVRVAADTTAREAAAQRRRHSKWRRRDRIELLILVVGSGLLPLPPHLLLVNSSSPHRPRACRHLIVLVHDLIVLVHDGGVSRGASSASMGCTSCAPFGE
jgi:hypothetical protein